MIGLIMILMIRLKTIFSDKVYNIINDRTYNNI